MEKMQVTRNVKWSCFWYEEIQIVVNKRQESVKWSCLWYEEIQIVVNKRQESVKSL